MKRNAFLLVALLFSATLNAAERIVDVHHGQELTREQLVDVIAGYEFILLGELHDNPRHHAARAELVHSLKPYRPNIVAEHLEAGKVFSPGDTLESGLKAAGFDLQGWEWPLHRPLFQAIAELHLPLMGGNIPPPLAKKIVREGESALPASLATLISAHPLTTSAENMLDADLERGHCGHLPKPMLPGMRLAQRARDAAMLDTLQKAPSRPVILLAGNGHVRKDYGVPSLMKSGRTISIGFVEEPLEHAISQGPFDVLWITEPAQRDDHCAQFRQGITPSAKQ